MVSEEPSSRNNKKLKLSLDLRVITVVLLLAVIAMLVIWKPWSTTATTDRTIEVTGQATISAEPDEYVFNPAYRFTNTDQDAALADVTAKSNQVVEGLKELGVSGSQIKTNADGHDYYYMSREDGRTDYYLRLTVTVNDKDLAQKVQDYLVTTTPEGSVTPRYQFSEAKRNELETQARDEATKNARSKADQSAENLGFKIGEVKSVTDGAGFDGVIPFDARAMELDSSSSSSSLQLQPGENEINYTVTVVYFLR